MGYTTDFEGKITFNRPLTDTEKNYINDFSNSRRMKRDSNVLMNLYNGKHGKPFVENGTAEDHYGIDGEYFANDNDTSTGVIDFNCPPGQRKYGSRDNIDGQPGLWCQWVITPDGKELGWDGGEKFYYYTEWLEYLFKHFFTPWGLIGNGEINWFGEERDDMGIIVVKDNIITTKLGKIVFK